MEWYLFYEIIIWVILEYKTCVISQPNHFRIKRGVNLEGGRSANKTTISFIINRENYPNNHFFPAMYQHDTNFLLYTILEKLLLFIFFIFSDFLY